MFQMMDAYLRNGAPYSNTEKDYWWIFGGKGGYTRCEIVNELLERPYNAHQLAEKLDKSYNNVKYHLRVLIKNYLIKSDNRKYSRFFFIVKNFKREHFKDIYELMSENERYKMNKTKLKSFIRRMKNKKG
ncbi:MAG: ArsR family transcriptional regulator [Candidatus Lokiarchaeota archaeon]|nr:ArsR family transcriptional regulator [Candidatus Lokiarchaeota archaeon]